MNDATSSVTWTAFSLNEERIPTPLEPEAIEAEGIRPHWVHVNADDPGQSEWLAQYEELDAVAIEALVAPNSRPRASEHEGGMIVVLRGINTNPGADPDDMISLRVWIDAKRIITASRRQQSAVADLTEEFHAGKGPRTPAGVLLRLSTLIVQRLSPLVDALGADLDEEEERVILDPLTADRMGLAEDLSQAISLRRHLAPQREALVRLRESGLKLLGKQRSDQLRNLADLVQRHIEEIDEMKERARVLQDLVRSEQAERLNQRMFVLSVITAVFLPLGLVTGLLGINVGGIPGASNEYGFAVTCVILVVVAVVALLLMRRTRLM
ncbi:MAG: zinc transporter ZntB [Planctomycetota bacterium]|nr:zinc transporter ZntB [Planctomycetota bacterium]